MRTGSSQTLRACTSACAAFLAVAGSMTWAAAAGAATTPKPIPHAHPAAAKPGTAVSGTITVSAASSLVNVLPVIAAAFEKHYPRTHVQFNFGGSNALVAQVVAGAPVDVLATASVATMNVAKQSDAVAVPVSFASNTMAVAMPPANPAHITTLSDLAKPGVRLAICATAVPCGSAASAVFKLNNLTVTPVTKDLDVATVLAQVESGDVDAGIVYVTDVRAARAAVSSVSIPAAQNYVTTYQEATTSHAPNPIGAMAFYNYLAKSKSASTVFTAYGFAPPQ